MMLSAREHVTIIISHELEAFRGMGEGVGVYASILRSVGERIPKAVISKTRIV